MKKLLGILLCLSLAANVWLLVPRDPARTPEWARPQPAAAPTAAADGNFAALRETNSPELARQLRAAGLSPAMVRALVAAHVRERHRAALDATATRNEESSWWRSAPPKERGDAELQHELTRQELNYRIASEIAEALGEPRPRRWSDDRYHFLSEEREAALRRIAADYEPLISRAETFPHFDQAKSELLRAEMRADIAALLSPAEMAEYEVRFSPHAKNLAARIGRIAGTEAEFRALLEFESAFRVGLDRVGRFPNSAEGDAMRTRYEAEVARQLGSERAIDYLWGGEPDFKTVRATAQQHQAAGAERDYLQVRTQTGERALAIYRDDALPLEEKRRALDALAKTARAELTANIPSRVLLDLPPGSLTWIDELERGRLRIYTPLTNGFGSFSLAAPTAPGSR